MGKNAGVIYLYKTPRFTSKQFDRLSNILDNSGQVILASGVIQQILADVDDQSFIVIVSSVCTSLIMWVMSLVFARKAEEL